MTNFVLRYVVPYVLRYLGVLTTGLLLLPLIDSTETYFKVLIPCVIAICVSNIYYYRMGEREEEL